MPDLWDANTQDLHVVLERRGPLGCRGVAGGNLWVRYQDRVGDFIVDENTDGALSVTGACRRQEDSRSLGTEV